MALVAPSRKCTLMLIITFAVLFMIFSNTQFRVREFLSIDESKPIAKQNWNIDNIECYVLKNMEREVITTHNCKQIFVSNNFIYIEKSILSRKINKICDECYWNDYLDILNYFKQNNSTNFVIMEDDAQFCNETITLLKLCYAKGLNCKLGNGATFNFFTRIDFELYNKTAPHYRKHIDWYLMELRFQTVSAKTVNHLGSSSIMHHNNGLIWRC
eukprot:132733_1